MDRDNNGFPPNFPPNVANFNPPPSSGFSMSNLINPGQPLPQGNLQPPGQPLSQGNLQPQGPPYGQPGHGGQPVLRTTYSPLPSQQPQNDNQHFYSSAGFYQPPRTVLQQQPSPTAIQQQPRPAVLQHQSQPIMLQQQPHPVVLQQQPHPVIPQQQPHTLVFQQQQRPVVPQQQSHPVVPQQQSHPVVLQQQQRPVIPQQQPRQQPTVYIPQPQYAVPQIYQIPPNQNTSFNNTIPPYQPVSHVQQQNYNHPMYGQEPGYQESMNSQSTEQSSASQHDQDDHNDQPELSRFRSVQEEEEEAQGTHHPAVYDQHDNAFQPPEAVEASASCADLAECAEEYQPNVKVHEYQPSSDEEEVQKNNDGDDDDDSDEDGNDDDDDYDGEARYLDTDNQQSRPAFNTDDYERDKNAHKDSNDNNSGTEETDVYSQTERDKTDEKSDEKNVVADNQSCVEQSDEGTSIGMDGRQNRTDDDNTSSGTNVDIPEEPQDEEFQVKEEMLESNTVQSETVKRKQKKGTKRKEPEPEVIDDSDTDPTFDPGRVGRDSDDPDNPDDPDDPDYAKQTSNRQRRGRGSKYRKIVVPAEPQENSRPKRRSKEIVKIRVPVDDDSNSTSRRRRSCDERPERVITTVENTTKPVSTYSEEVANNIDIIYKDLHALFVQVKNDVSAMEKLSSVSASLWPNLELSVRRIRYYNKLSITHLELYYAINNVLDWSTDIVCLKDLAPLTNLGLRFDQFDYLLKLMDHHTELSVSVMTALGENIYQNFISLVEKHRPSKTIIIKEDIVENIALYHKVRNNIGTSFISMTEAIAKEAPMQKDLSQASMNRLTLFTEQDWEKQIIQWEENGFSVLLINSTLMKMVDHRGKLSMWKNHMFFTSHLEVPKTDHVKTVVPEPKKLISIIQKGSEKKSSTPVRIIIPEHERNNKPRRNIIYVDPKTEKPLSKKPTVIRITQPTEPATRSERLKAKESQVITVEEDKGSTSLPVVTKNEPTDEDPLGIPTGDLDEDPLSEPVNSDIEDETLEGIQDFLDNSISKTVDTNVFEPLPITDFSEKENEEEEVSQKANEANDKMETSVGPESDETTDIISANISDVEESPADEDDSRGAGSSQAENPFFTGHKGLQESTVAVDTPEEAGNEINTVESQEQEKDDKEKKANSSSSLVLPRSLSKAFIFIDETIRTESDSEDDEGNISKSRTSADDNKNDDSSNNDNDEGNIGESSISADDNKNNDSSNNDDDEDNLNDHASVSDSKENTNNVESEASKEEAKQVDEVDALLASSDDEAVEKTKVVKSQSLVSRKSGRNTGKVVSYADLENPAGFQVVEEKIKREEEEYEHQKFTAESMEVKPDISALSYKRDVPDLVPLQKATGTDGLIKVDNLDELLTLDLSNLTYVIPTDIKERMAASAFFRAKPNQKKTVFRSEHYTQTDPRLPQGFKMWARKRSQGNHIDRDFSSPDNMYSFRSRTACVEYIKLLDNLAFISPPKQMPGRVSIGQKVNLSKREEVKPKTQDVIKSGKKSAPKHTTSKVSVNFPEGVLNTSSPAAEGVLNTSSPAAKKPNSLESNAVVGIIYSRDIQKLVANVQSDSKAMEKVEKYCSAELKKLKGLEEACRKEVFLISDTTIMAAYYTIWNMLMFRNAPSSSSSNLSLQVKMCRGLLDKCSEETTACNQMYYNIFVNDLQKAEEFGNPFILHHICNNFDTYCKLRDDYLHQLTLCHKQLEPFLQGIEKDSVLPEHVGQMFKTFFSSHPQSMIVMMEKTCFNLEFLVDVINRALEIKGITERITDAKIASLKKSISFLTIGKVAKAGSKTSGTIQLRSFAKMNASEPSTSSSAPSSTSSAETSEDMLYLWTKIRPAEALIKRLGQEVFLRLERDMTMLAADVGMKSYEYRRLYHTVNNILLYEIKELGALRLCHPMTNVSLEVDKFQALASIQPGYLAGVYQNMADVHIEPGAEFIRSRIKINIKLYHEKRNSVFTPLWNLLKSIEKIEVIWPLAGRKLNQQQNAYLKTMLETKRSYEKFCFDFETVDFIYNISEIYDALKDAMSKDKEKQASILGKKWKAAENAEGDSTFAACPKCRFVCNTLKDLVLHFSQTHYSIQLITLLKENGSCSVCFFHHKDKMEVMKHMALVHSAVMVKYVSWKCVICESLVEKGELNYGDDVIGKFQTDVIDHLQNRHKVTKETQRFTKIINDETIRCPIFKCYFTGNFEEVKYHLARTHMFDWLKKFVETYLSQKYCIYCGEEVPGYIYEKVAHYGVEHNLVYEKVKPFASCTIQILLSRPEGNKTTRKEAAEASGSNVIIVDHQTDIIDDEDEVEVIDQTDDPLAESTNRLSQSRETTDQQETPSNSSLKAANEKKRQDTLEYCKLCKKNLLKRKFTKHVALYHYSKELEAATDGKFKSIGTSFKCNSCQLTLLNMADFKFHYADSHMPEFQAVLSQFVKDKTLSPSPLTVPTGREDEPDTFQDRLVPMVQPITVQSDSASGGESPLGGADSPPRQFEEGAEPAVKLSAGLVPDSNWVARYKKFVREKGLNQGPDDSFTISSSETVEKFLEEITKEADNFSKLDKVVEELEVLASITLSQLDTVSRHLLLKAYWQKCDEVKSSIKSLQPMNIVILLSQILAMPNVIKEDIYWLMKKINYVHDLIDGKPVALDKKIVDFFDAIDFPLAPDDFKLGRPHRQSLNPKTSVPLHEPEYRCDACGRSFSKEIGLRTHVRQFCKLSKALKKNGNVTLTTPPTKKTVDRGHRPTSDTRKSLPRGDQSRKATFSSDNVNSPSSSSEQVDLGKRMLAYRGQHGLSQRTVAELITKETGIPVETNDIYRLENSCKPPASCFTVDSWLKEKINLETEKKDKILERLLSYSHDKKLGAEAIAEQITADTGTEFTADLISRLSLGNVKVAGPKRKVLKNWLKKVHPFQESAPVLAESKPKSDSVSKATVEFDKKKTEYLRSKLLDLKMKAGWSYGQMETMINKAVAKKPGFSVIKKKDIANRAYGTHSWNCRRGATIYEWMKQENFLDETESSDLSFPMVMLNDEEIDVCDNESNAIKLEKESEDEDQPEYTKFCLDCEGCPGSNCDHSTHPRVPVVEDLHRLLKGHTNYSDLGKFMKLPVPDVAYNAKHGAAVRSGWEHLIQEGKTSPLRFESPVMCKATDCSSSFSDPIDTFLHISVNHLPLKTGSTPKTEDMNEEDEFPEPKTPMNPTEDGEDYKKGGKRSRCQSLAESPKPKKKFGSPSQKSKEKMENLNPKLLEHPYFSSHLCEVQYVTETAGYVEEPRLPKGWTKTFGRRSCDVFYKSPDNHQFRSLTNARKYVQLMSEEES